MNVGFDTCYRKVSYYPRTVTIFYFRHNLSIFYRVTVSRLALRLLNNTPNIRDLQRRVGHVVENY